MFRFVRIISILMAILLFSVFSSIGFADIVVTPPDGVMLPTVNQDPGVAVASIIRYFLLLAGILAVIMITWGGIHFILSSGEDEKMKKARKTVIYAFVGLILAGLAYTIVEVITGAQIITP